MVPVVVFPGKGGLGGGGDGNNNTSPQEVVVMEHGTELLLIMVVIKDHGSYPFSPGENGAGGNGIVIRYVDPTF